MRILWILVVGASLAVTSCGKDKGSSSHDHHAAMGSAAPASSAGSTALVEVPKEGKKFAPPIQASQLPAGVWYCDMGTVEYARAEKGDGVCPVCHMKLKQKAADAK